MSSLDVILPTNKLNDFKFINRVLLTVKLDVVQMLAKKNNKNFENLVKEFIPELENYEDEELFKKYNISSKIFGYEKEMPIKKAKSSGNQVKEIITFNTQVNSNVSESKTEPIELKPTIKKKIIIKKTESVSDTNIQPTPQFSETKEIIIPDINNLSLDETKKVRPVKITIKKINKKLDDNTEDTKIDGVFDMKPKGLDTFGGNNIENIKTEEKPMEIDTPTLQTLMDNVGAPKKIKIKVKNVNQ